MLDGPPRKASASNLASRLDEMVNGDAARSHSYWLAGVPSHCPIQGRPGQHRPFGASEAATVREYIEHLPAYRKIFTGSEGAAPLADSLDMILTSCGPKERPLGYEGVQWLESIGVTRERAARLVAGDISGILLKAAKLSIEDARLVDTINDAWMGAKLQHLARCARRALDRSLPGVVVCAIGANKAGSVHEIIRLGIANHLLIDTDCWRALERRI
jgi:DNA-binding transcriptional regulator LsrR (DeoR family)